MAVSPKLRYQIFKRDNWVCQYCGRKAPFVELQVEHKKSKADSGTDESDNLTTSCFECNIGKGKESLSIPQDPTIISRLLVDDYVKRLQPLWNLRFPTVFMPEGIIRKALYFLDLADVCQSIEQCWQGYSGGLGREGKNYHERIKAYLYGILRNKSRNFTTRPRKTGISQHMA